MQKETEYDTRLSLDKWINECRAFIHTQTHTQYDKSGQDKRRQSETDAVVQKRLSRFLGLRNNLVSPFSNPDLQGQTVPLTRPLGAEFLAGGSGGERKGKDSRQGDQGSARVAGFFFFLCLSSPPPHLLFLPR